MQNFDLFFRERQWSVSALQMSAILAISDFLILLSIWACSVWIKYFVTQGQLSLLLYWRLAPCLGLFVVMNAFIGLYPGILLSPPEEIKKISQSTSLIFLALAAGVFLSKQGMLFSRSIFLTAWVGSIVILPYCRSRIRKIAHRLNWWGVPAIILGAGKTGKLVVEALGREYRLGLKPIAFFDDDLSKLGQRVANIPVLGPLGAACGLADKYRNTVAILAMPGLSPSKLVAILEGAASDFRRVILVPDLFGMSSLWVSAFDLGGIVGLDLQQKLLDPRRQIVKRIMELCLIAFFLPFLMPLCVLIALSVKLSSKGPVFFRQKRIGFGGKDIEIWKFRTMVSDAAAVLQNYLAHNPELRIEWEANHKLTCDPRITPIGRLLRKTSLDELPQLWNVVRGDLSLVGPRPIVWDEVDKYKNGFSLYKKVRPGLTGLWQISGRSDTSYEERIRLDSFYVRNWSVWLDIYILTKTPEEVLRCRGAC